MNKKWKAEQIPDLNGKIIVITGANDGIGFETTKELARKGAQVILASRNPEKVTRAIKMVKEEVPSAELDFIKLDLASLQSIRQFADSFQSRYQNLDILINNAGIMLVPYGLTEDGFEKNLGVNHLGHFALTGLLIEQIESTPGSRIVNVSSNAHHAGEMDFDNLMFEDSSEYRPMKAYSRSKLANLMFTYELHRRFQDQGVDAAALAAHPGITATGLVDHLFDYRLTWAIQPFMKTFFQNAAMGALPSLRAAVDPDVKDGSYIGPDGPGERSGYPVMVNSSRVSRDTQKAKRLWQISEELTGVRYLS